MIKINNSAHIQRAIIKPTNECNLDCIYCGAWRNVKGKMQLGTLRNIYKSLSKSVNNKGTISIYWHGGEPLLVGIDYFREAIQLQKKYRPTVFKNLMVTNLTLCNDKWANFFAEESFIISTSIDGPSEIHDKYRYFYNRKGSFKKVIRAIEILRKHNVYVGGAIATLHKGNVNHIDKIYQTYRDLRLNLSLGYMHPSGEKICRQLKISDDEYFSALKKLLEIWLLDTDPIEIDVFEIIISAIIKHTNVSSCLDDLVGFNVDGKIYPCHAMIGCPEFEIGKVTENFNLMSSNYRWDKIRDITNRLIEYCSNCEVFGICPGLCPYINSILWNNPSFTLHDCTAAKNFYLWAKDKLEPYLTE